MCPHSPHTIIYVSVYYYMYWSSYSSYSYWCGGWLKKKAGGAGTAGHNDRACRCCRCERPLYFILYSYFTHTFLILYSHVTHALILYACSNWCCKVRAAFFTHALLVRYRSKAYYTHSLPILYSNLYIGGEEAGGDALNKEDSINKEKGFYWRHVCFVAEDKVHMW